MRLGRERPRKGSARYAPDSPSAAFNEAGARTPQKGARPDVEDEILRKETFNEAGARTPQKGTSSPEAPFRRPSTFNEAGARTPQKGRRRQDDARLHRGAFNEAGARTPQKGRRPGASTSACTRPLQ